jgi:transcriptional regulator with XRE-family HTH domain
MVAKIELDRRNIKPVQRDLQPDPDADQIGAAMFDMRQAAQMTQAEVAAVLGLERSSVTNIESGKQRAELRHLTRFADHLGLDVHITLKPKPVTTPAEGDSK